MAGILYLCATPIGNMEDITYRAVRILREADVIAAEDTRNSRKLLQRYEIDTPMTSYHEFNKIEKGKALLCRLRAGENVALITDAGTPGISDPGEELVAMCYQEGIDVFAVPGPAACIAAVTSSGKPSRRFSFEAFLPRDKKERQRVLEEMERETRTMIVYEAPHHLAATLAELREHLGNRELTLCRELTKRYEEKMSMTLDEALELYQEKEPRGEYVLVIAGKSREQIREERQQAWSGMSLEQHMDVYLGQGMDRKEAMKSVARDLGVGKREIYRRLLEE